MQKLSKKQILEKIKSQNLFYAEIDDGSLTIQIESYVPYICTAIHNGHNLRENLDKKCSLSPIERLEEEDAYTGEMIVSMPITLIANDSRYEYDLNRPLENAIYKEAWGKKVWKSPLTSQQISATHEKHKNFYKILHALIRALESKYGSVVIYDVHSYNHLRMKDLNPPMFNLGTYYLNEGQGEAIAKNYLLNLKKIKITNVKVSVGRNKAFEGRGYLAQYIAKNFKKSLVFPTEIAKFYLDNKSQELYPQILFEIKIALKEAILKNAILFSKNKNLKRIKIKHDLLPKNIDPEVQKIDSDLYQLCKNVETLHYINPINLNHERKRFFKLRGRYEPDFKYRQLKLDPHEFRRRLYRLPMENIQDISLQQIYRDVMDGYAQKIDLLTSIGTEQFLYNSLRYYGEPTENDIKNSEFILHCNTDKNIPGNESISAEQALEAFEKEAARYKINCRVELSNKILAGAMVDNAKKIILINKNESWTKKDLNALVHHELGVHYITTINSIEQPLKILRLGLPENTYTQEGLAILSEYLSGNITLERLKILALRVIAVQSMIKEGRFSRTFRMLVEEYFLDDLTAFNVTARAFRGSGFTKDFLYLKGFKDSVLNFMNHDITNIYVGKSSFKYLTILNELCARNIFVVPKFLPRSYLKPQNKNEIIDYLVNSII